jgi:four helix bundle protein
VTYEEWLKTVPEAITADTLWRMTVYRLALFLNDLAWHDVTKLVGDARTMKVADQMYRAVGSVGANIAEGYSRRSGKERAHFYEYALGSARESRHWYYSARHVLALDVVEHRLSMLAEITRLLLTIVPQERIHNLAEEYAEYDAHPRHLLDNPPLS